MVDQKAQRSARQGFTLAVVTLCVFGALAGSWIAAHEQRAAAEAKASLDRTKFIAVFGFSPESVTPGSPQERVMKQVVVDLEREYQAAERRLVPLRLSPALDPGEAGVIELEFEADCLSKRLATARRLAEVPFPK